MDDRRTAAPSAHPARTTGQIPPPPPPVPERQPAPAPARPSLEGNVKDTIESILVAFILAFIFRAFVVEAFVIPTGSMAPTLLGAHMRFQCPDCGYRFDVNYQGTDTGDDVYIPARAGESKVYAIFCPNCGFRLPRSETTNPAVRYGDRILVLKYLYLLQEPSRWDVVVFKSPHEPDRFDYTQNYIKRLVGKPGETIMILDGDVYVGQGDDLSTFKVQRKPGKVQDALWRIVYDNDYRPQVLPRRLTNQYGEDAGLDPAWALPWQQADGTGWDVGNGPRDGRTLRFANLNGSSILAFDAAADPKKYALTDWLAYDVTVNQGPGGEGDTYLKREYVPENNVSDVKLSFYYQRSAGPGPLRVQLTKLDHTFEAQIRPDGAALLMDDKRIGGWNDWRMPSDRPVHVELSNVDYRVTLKIDGKEVAFTNEEQYHPDVPGLLEAFRAGRRLPKAGIRIIGDQQECALTHVALWRDVYYTNREPNNGAPLRWGTPYDFPNRLVHLGKDEFFVLGDNSLISGDARYWKEPIELPEEGLHVADGRVPRRFMLGKAFFVYWPAGYRPIGSAPALVPNFGDMRFIH